MGERGGDGVGGLGLDGEVTDLCVPCLDLVLLGSLLKCVYRGTGGCAGVNTPAHNGSTGDPYGGSTEGSTGDSL